MSATVCRAAGRRAGDRRPGDPRKPWVVAWSRHCESAPGWPPSFSPWRCPRDAIRRRTARIRLSGKRWVRSFPHSGNPEVRSWIRTRRAKALAQINCGESCTGRFRDSLRGVARIGCASMRPTLGWSDGSSVVAPGRLSSLSLSLLAPPDFPRGTGSLRFVHDLGLSCASSHCIAGAGRVSPSGPAAAPGNCAAGCRSGAVQGGQKSRKRSALRRAP